MNFRFTVLETSLNRAEFRWKFLRFVKFTSIVGIALGVLLLALGLAIVSGWISTKPVALILFGIMCAVGLIAWIIGAIGIMASEPDRRWLAATIEGIDRRFLDRLNTLLFLESRRSEPRAQSFALRIARQTQTLLAQKESPAVFSATGALCWFLGLVLFSTVLVSLNSRYGPFSRLVASAQARNNSTTPKEQPLDLSQLATNTVEQNKPWGDVRITDPAMDLRVTKVDVVPLQIEAAANERLQEVNWFTALNGGSEQPHPLPAGAEPRYAIYHPDIYLDELNLSDWDVVTYYARAQTENSNAYASDVFFIEIRPFREDIAKLPGGEGGKPYQNLNEISGLISRQQHVVRQTHEHVKNPPAQENLRVQDRKKLAGAETDLAEASRHLYAEMASEMENRPIGEALDNLAKAERSLDAAGGQLEHDDMPEAQKTERTALSQLVAARKMFQKAITENPDAFQPKEEQENDPSPVADSTQKLNQMAEYRNEAKAAQELMQKSLERQRQLAQQARTAPLSRYPRLAEEQRNIRDQIENFAEQHPAPFQGSETQSKAAQEAMDKSSKSLADRRGDARNAAQEAANELEKLSNNMQAHTSGQQLADAYKLKQMLDQQRQVLDQASKPDSNTPDETLKSTAQAARQTLDQLKNSAEQEPTREAFGQPLRDALSGQNKSDLDKKLDALQKSQGSESKQRAAGEAAGALGKVSDAFSSSQPKSLQMARKTDSLKPEEQDSFRQGLAELDSLIKRLHKAQTPPQEDQQKQGQQALANLQNGMRSQFGDNARGNQLLAQLQEALKAEQGLEPGNLQKLLAALQQFSFEHFEQLARNDRPEVGNIDPARLPPAYRSRIQKYFEKLSEK